MEDRYLFIYSVAFSAWAVATIVVPYVRGKTDLLTARSFFLVGALLYVGFSGLKAATEPHFRTYMPGVYYRYFLYATIFFVVFHYTYKLSRWPGRVASRRLLEWPVEDGLGVWFPFLLAGTAMALQVVMLAVSIPGLRVLVIRTGLIAPAFAMVFALAIWRRQKLNPLAIAVVAFSFFIGAYLAFAIGGGRRFLYAVLVAIPICYYWWHLRYRSPLKTMAVFAAMLVVAPVGDSAYRAARWYGHFGASRNEEVGAGTRWEIFKNALFNRDESFSQSTLQIGQTTVENSLLVSYIFNEGSALFPTFYVKPLHSIYVMLVEPIPRVFWEDKPLSLGVTLPYESKVLNRATARTNWGPGIVGHSIHDGGIPVAIFYAVLIGVMIRFFDELLVRHPGNPFFLAFLSGASVQLAGITRGDLATMVPLVLFCFVFMLALAWATRLVVGVDRPWALRAGHVAAGAGGR
jgi:hypothetical protein